jgi:ubiquinone/menaquinone biosynthesis C-methylase UbiE
MNVIPKKLDNYFVLDLACGFGSYAYRMRVEKEGRPIIVGLDLWKPYIMKIKELRLYDDVILGDANHLPFISNSFDIVLASEIIEHIPKKFGERFLFEVERVSKKMVIIVTPCGFMPQKDIHGNPYEKHLSEWNCNDFKKYGYVVKIVGSLQLPSILDIIIYSKPGTWLIKKILKKDFFGKEIIAIKYKNVNDKNHI